MSSFKPSPAQIQHRKRRLANPENNISPGLSRAVCKPPQWYVRAPGILIGLLMLSSVTWAVVGKWPVVVEASGQLQPLEGLRPVKSDQGGTIVEVLVKNNQDVRSGEVLVKLDPAISQAEIDRLQEQAKLLRQNISEREAQKTGSAFQAREREYEQRLNAAEADVKRNQAAIEEAQAQRDDLQGQLATEQEREKRLRSVVEQGAISRERLIEIQGNLNSLENQIQAQNNRIDQAQQSYESAKIEIDRIEEEYQREIAEKENYIQEQISSLSRELADIEGQLELARERRKTQDIEAPMTGRVYDVKATKGTVQPGEELLSIFPEGGRLILKVSVQNQDRAMIEEGMPRKGGDRRLTVSRLR